MTDTQISKTRDMAQDGRFTPREMVHVLCDMLSKMARDGMEDNARDQWSHVMEGLEPETEDQRDALELWKDAQAVQDKNVALAYNVGHALRSLMEDVQDQLRHRFDLPAWNPMHECHDLIGDTDGLSPKPYVDESVLARQEYEREMDRKDV